MINFKELKFKIKIFLIAFVFSTVPFFLCGFAITEITRLFTPIDVNYFGLLGLCGILGLIVTIWAVYKAYKM